MEFVRLKYANNKLIDSNIKEHRDIINDYVDKKGYEYVGFIPTLFGPSGKTLEIDLLFKKPIVQSTQKSAPTQKRVDSNRKH